MKHVCLLIIFSIAFPMLVVSQKQKATPKSIDHQPALAEKQSQAALNRIKAINLIEQTVNEVVLWDDRAAGVSALTEASNLLWDENPRARLWLTNAWDLIESIDERENPAELRQIWHGSHRSNLRTKVLNVALRHDAQLADTFLQKLENNQGEEKDERGLFDDRTKRSEQLLRLAMNAIERNPALALDLAERSLLDGISFNLQTVLLQLRQKDAALADRLFDLALARLTNSPATFSENQVLASYLFQPGQVVARLPDGATTVAVVQTQLPVQSPAQSEPARARNFLKIVHRMLLSAHLPAEQSASAGDFILLANSLAQPFQTYAPDLWQSIQTRQAQFAAVFPAATAKPNATVSEKEREAAKNGASRDEVSRLRVDALQDAAESEPNPIARKLKFAEAALATAPPDFERGKSLAEKIESDGELRQEIVTFLYYRAALTFLAANKLTRAEETALKIPWSLERALTLIALAQKLGASKRQLEKDKTRSELPPEIAHQHAIELLAEAEKSLQREEATTNIAKVRLGKTAVSHLLDTAQALIDFEQAIAVINRLERFDPSDAGIPRLGIEGFATTTFTVPRVNYGFGFRDALEPLVRNDFNRTAIAIDSLASPSVRGLCRLEAARQVLLSLPKPSTMKATAREITISGRQ